MKDYWSRILLGIVVSNAVCILLHPIMPFDSWQSNVLYYEVFGILQFYPATRIPFEELWK